MRKRGRPPLTDDQRPKLPAKLPKKENERHRQMRAYFLSLPPNQRTLQAVIDHFGVSPMTVYNASIAFHWIDDADKRDASITDPFAEQYQTHIDSARKKAFQFLCTALETEMKRQALELTDEQIIEKIKIGDLDGATKDWTVKDWMSFIKNLSMKAKDFKDFNQIIDGLRKVVFEWDPNKSTQKQPVSMPITGGKNYIMINNPYANKPTTQQQLPKE